MRATLAFVLLAGALYAQQGADPYRYVPADAVAILRTKGGAGWRAALGETNLGKAIAAAGTSASWPKLLDAAREAFDEDGAHEKRFREVAEALAAHGGDIVAAVRIEVSEQDPGEEPRVCVSLAAFGDGKTDLARMQRQIEALLPEGPADRELCGQQMRVHALGKAQVTSPFLHDGALVMLLASDLEQQAPLCLEPRETKFPVAPALDACVFGLQIEPIGLLKTLLRKAKAKPEIDPQLIEKGVDFSGIRSVQRVTWTLQADGPYVGQEIRLAFNEEPRGALEVLLPVRRGNPKLLQIVPAGARNRSVGVFGVDELRRLWGTFFERFGGDLPMTREQIEGKFTEVTKLRLDEDVLSLFDGEMLRLDDFDFAGSEIPEDARLARIDQRLGNSCFVFLLRDANAMAQNLEKALRARGLHAARKSEEYGDTKIYRLNVLGAFPLEYAFAGDVFVVGLGGSEGTRANLRALLDTVAARAKGEAPPDLHAALRERLQGWPTDWTAIEVGDLTEALGGMSTLAIQASLDDELDEEELGLFAALAEVTSHVSTSLERSGAAHAVTAAWSTRAAYVLRSRW